MTVLQLQQAAAKECQRMQRCSTQHLFIQATRFGQIAGSMLLGGRLQDGFEILDDRT